VLETDREVSAQGISYRFAHSTLRVPRQCCERKSDTPKGEQIEGKDSRGMRSSGRVDASRIACAVFTT